MVLHTKLENNTKPFKSNLFHSIKPNQIERNFSCVIFFFIFVCSLIELELRPPSLSMNLAR